MRRLGRGGMPMQTASRLAGLIRPGAGNFRHLPDLAASLNNLSNRLANAGDIG